ncbi:MAG: enoyl-CoA hydratase [Promethearchaeota archaeon]
MSEHMLIDPQDGILRIQFNRPEKKNAITLAMYTALTEAIKKADTDDSIRVIFITGTEDCFTAGNDLTDFMKTPATDTSAPVFVFMKTISQAEKPIVAAVNGLAIGIGTTMLLHCDLVYAGESTLFQLPFIKLGICPELGSTLILPQMAGYQRAAELLLLGEFFDAKTAREIGFVNTICTDTEVYDVALVSAQELAAQAPTALRVTKSLMKRPTTPVIDETIDEEINQLIRLLDGPEAKEALTAFKERRKPDFSQFK